MERKFIDFRLCLLRRESGGALLPGSVKSLKRKEAPEPSEKVSFCKSTNDRSRKLERDAWTRNKVEIYFSVNSRKKEDSSKQFKILSGNFSFVQMSTFASDVSCAVSELR